MENLLVCHTERWIDGRITETVKKNLYSKKKNVPQF